MRPLRPAGALLIILATLAAGHTQAQTLSPAYAAPQQRVTLPDGRHLNFVCQGQGSPTVIMTAGAGDWSASWSRVQPLVARQTRVCGWDRPGYGFSDAATQPQTADAVAADLAAGLQAGKIAPPYLLVAHSAGSYATLLFADRHRAQVAGMVLVDPSLPDMISRVEQISPLAAKMLRADLGMRAAALHRCAANPASAAPADASICFTLPEHARPLVAQMAARDRQPARLRTRASLFEQFEANTQAARNPARDYGEMPLAVLTSEREPLAALPVEEAARGAALEALWNTGHAELAGLSRRGSRQTVPGSGHQIQLERPEAVASAIVAMLGTVPAK